MSGHRPIASGRRTVADVAADGLCCFCGACEGVCPTGAVRLERRGSFPVPVVDAARCTECGLCVAVCPGIGVDFDSLNGRLFGAPPADRLLGHWRSCGVGAATDTDLAFGRTSGGIATVLASWGLEAGWWQGVLVSRFAHGTIGETETWLATTPEEVAAAANSLYCPVPACRAWSDVRDFPGKVCMVGLPCHVHALRKAQHRLDWLREKVALTVGLFCLGTPGFAATEALLGWKGIDARDVDTLAYRAEGWPGTTVVRVRGEPRPRRWPRGMAGNLADRLRSAGAFQRRWVFAARRCLTCPDHLAELADLSLGDAWHPRYRSDRMGLNLLLVRSARAAEVVGQLRDAGAVALEDVPRATVLESQGTCLAAKKGLGPVLIDELARRGVPTPRFTGQPPPTGSRWDRLLAWTEWLQTRLAADRDVWPVLPLLAPWLAVLRRLRPTALVDPLVDAG